MEWENSKYGMRKNKINFDKTLKLIVCQYIPKAMETQTNKEEVIIN